MLLVNYYPVDTIREIKLRLISFCMNVYFCVLALRAQDLFLKSFKTIKCYYHSIKADFTLILCRLRDTEHTHTYTDILIVTMCCTFISSVSVRDTVNAFHEFLIPFRHGAEETEKPGSQAGTRHQYTSLSFSVCVFLSLSVLYSILFILFFLFLLLFSMTDTPQMSWRHE